MAISPNVQKECELTRVDYNCLKHKDVLEYLLENGIYTHLNEVAICHLAHSSSILFKRITSKIVECLPSVYEDTLRHLFDCSRLILGVMDTTKHNKFTVTTLPDVAFRDKYIEKLLPKLLHAASQQEAKHYKDARALMEFALELVTANSYSFALELMCKQPCIELLMKCLMDKTKAVVRVNAMRIFKHVIEKLEEKVRLHKDAQARRQTEFIVSLVLKHLKTALHIAGDEAGIDNSNDAFPDDLKSYVERKPKLTPYLEVLDKLLTLYPQPLVAKLTEPGTWRMMVDIVEKLERGADQFSWAKNDDKLKMLQIILLLIDRYKVDADKLYHVKLIWVLTKQYLVSTRSKVVSPHMAKVVNVTYQLLTHWAKEFDEDDDTEIIINGENTESKHEEEDNRRSGNNSGDEEELKEGDNWIQKRIVDRHWFLWGISDIVTPHKVYQTTMPAESILAFIAKVIDYKCFKRASSKEMIKKACKKWNDLLNNHMSHEKRCSQFPRETVLKLFMLILRTERDHYMFLQPSNNTKKLLREWIQYFMLFDLLSKPAEERSAHHVGLDFFQFHVTAISKYPSLQTDVFQHYIGLYLNAAISVIAYNAHKQHETEWQQILQKARNLLRCIFDLERIYPANSHRIIEAFMTRSNIIFPFSCNANDYIKRKESPEEQEEVFEYATGIVHAAKTTQSIREQLQKPATKFTEQKQAYCYRLCASFEQLLVSYFDFEGDCKWKFKWYQQMTTTSTASGGKFAGMFQKYLASMCVSCWFVQIMGCTLPPIVDKVMRWYLSEVCKSAAANNNPLSNPVCWMVFCVLITSNTLRNEHLLDDFHSQVLLCLANATIDQQENEAKSKERKSKLLQVVKKKVATKYLTARYEVCLHFMHKRLSVTTQETERKTECDKECKNADDDEKNQPENKEMKEDEEIRVHCYGYIRYYYHMLSARDSVACIHANQLQIDYWHGLLQQTQQMTQVLSDRCRHNNIKQAENDQHAQMMQELQMFLTKIAQIIDGKLTESRHRMQQQQLEKQKEKEREVEQDKQAAVPSQSQTQSKSSDHEPQAMTVDGNGEREAETDSK